MNFVEIKQDMKISLIYSSHGFKFFPSLASPIILLSNKDLEVAIQQTKFKI